MVDARRRHDQLRQSGRAFLRAGECESMLIGGNLEQQWWVDKF